jgi:hypothetical protein
MAQATLPIKDLRRLGYAGRGDVVLGEGHRWRQREQRRKHSATSSLTNHMVPQYNSQIQQLLVFFF